MRRAIAALAAAAAAAALPGCGGDARTPVRVAVYAATSLAPAMEEIAGIHRIRTGDEVETRFASSSELARQIDAGAPADVFVSANEEWMEWLVGRGRIRPGSRFDLAGNALVIVAPAAAPFVFAVGDSGGLPAAFEGRIAMGDPDRVPLGEYAKQSLVHAGWWEALEPRIVRATDARAALALVERGECAAGIAYASDLTGAERVTVVERIPDDWHDPVEYAVGLVEGRALPGADRFMETLRSPDAARILRKHGFRVPVAVAP